MKRFLPVVISLVVLAGCTKESRSVPDAESNSTRSYSGKFVRDYFTLLCKITKTTPGFFPPQASRAYGYVGIANYEAVVYGINGVYSLAGQLNGLSAEGFPTPSASFDYNWALSGNAAIAGMMRMMFEKNITPANLASIDSMEKVNYNALSAGLDATLVNRSVKLGQDISAALYEYSKTDGGHESYVAPFQLPYNIPVFPGCWEPTGAVLTPVSPFWGNNRIMLQRDIDKTQGYVPVAYSTATNSNFYNEAMKTYEQVKHDNSAEEITIAKYWADDPFNTCTPTGHTFGIMTQLLSENDATLEKTAVAYAQLGIAEMDAFIACWKTKYKYCLIRPVTYIKKYIDPTFATVIGTPAFPAFSSGHSYEIGAGTRIMVHLFTDGSGDYHFTDYSQLQYGFAARTYTNFNTMALECANSRFYAGIHYTMDNTAGIGAGRTIGDNVNHYFNWPQNVR